MDVTLCAIGLIIVSTYAFYEFLQRLADNTEYKHQKAQKNQKPLLIVEKKGKGWELIENQTDN